MVPGSQNKKKADFWVLMEHDHRWTAVICWWKYDYLAVLSFSWKSHWWREKKTKTNKGKKKREKKIQITIISDKCQSRAPSYTTNKMTLVQKYQSIQTKVWLVKKLSICRNITEVCNFGRQSKRDIKVSSISDPLLYKPKCKVIGMRI